ncbi:MAG: hypothetical protein VYA55_05130 [Pseudomonadota bacterium]|nr:hypothetical protein [Pseudomonadota bacterium]
MRKAFLAVSLCLGLSACGGGSSGSDDTSGAYRSGPDLVGTWIRTETDYYTATGEPFAIHRETVIVTDAGNYLDFTNCVSGDVLMANIDHDVVEFYSAGVSSLHIIDDTTLTVNISQGSTQTELLFNKVSDDTAVVLADVAFTQPVANSNWEQVCVETVLSQNSDDQLKVKAVNASRNITVGLNAVFDGGIQTTVYDFPVGTNDADAYVLSSSLNTVLVNPDGTIEVSQGVTTNLAVDLDFEDSVSSAQRTLRGTIALDTDWLSFD